MGNSCLLLIPHNTARGYSGSRRDIKNMTLWNAEKAPHTGENLINLKHLQAGFGQTKIAEWELDSGQKETLPVSHLLKDRRRALHGGRQRKEDIKLKRCV